MSLWVIIPLLLLVGALVGYVIYRQMQERRLVERRLSLNPSGKDDALLFSNRLADVFNDQERIRKYLEKDSELALAVWRAGFRTHQQRALMFALVAILPLVLATAAALLLLTVGTDGNNLLYAAGMAILGFLLPKKLIVGRAEARMKRLSDELSLFMQMLRILFDSGLAVEQALRVLVIEGRKVLPELGYELDTALRRAEQGLSLESELQTTAAALDHPEFTDIVVVLRQMLTQGGSAKSSLTKMIEVMNGKRLTDLQEKVSKLSAKMTIVMVVFFFPALVILIAGPGFISLADAFS